MKEQRRMGAIEALKDILVSFSFVVSIIGVERDGSDFVDIVRLQKRHEWSFRFVWGISILIRHG
jgi:hypothetical protein